MMQRFLRKPQVVEAIEFTEETEAYCLLVCDGELEKDEESNAFFLHTGENQYIRIRHGVHLVNDSGVWYAETKESFSKTYTHVY